MNSNSTNRAIQHMKSYPHSAVGGSKLSSFFSLKYLLFLLVLLFIILSFYFLYRYLTKSKNVNCGGGNGGNSVIEGNTNGDVELMLFYVDWCPHCKTAKPEWEQVKTEYNGKTINGFNVLFNEINCTNESPDVDKMINQYKIDGYPTIKMLKNGQVIEFDAKPTKANLTQFLNTAI